MASEDQEPGAPSSTMDQDAMMALVWRDLGDAGRLVARGRVAAMLAGGSLVLALINSDPSRWRLLTLAVAAAVVGPVLVRDFFFFRSATITARHLPYLLAPIIVLHTVIIAVTGGAESPFLVLYVAIGMAPAVVIGRARPFLLWAAVPLTLLWLFTLAVTTGAVPHLRPLIFAGATHFAGNPIYAYVQALVFTASCLLGGAFTLAVRAALERSVRRAAGAQSELVASMQERNRELMALSGELAHELKNPLASIQGLSTLVERRLEPGSKEREHMRVLVAEVRRMGTTLDELLNFSRPVLGLAARAAQPERLLADMIRLHQGLAQQHGAELSLRPSAPAPAAVRCDPRKIEQVLANLLHNAIEATGAGGHITATVTARPDGGVCFVVDDDGSGIEPRLRGRLFEAGATSKPEGSGLGLTIARAIAEQHGGRLSLSDRPGGGCRAELTLPASPPAGSSEAGRGASWSRPSQPAGATVTDEERQP